MYVLPSLALKNAAVSNKFIYVIRIILKIIRHYFHKLLEQILRYNGDGGVFYLRLKRNVYYLGEIPRPFSAMFHNTYT
jgi:hypothetical protein